MREFATFAAESVGLRLGWTKKGDRLLGCARMWHVRVGGKRAMFLGPFAVEEGERSAGFGARLIARACEAAEAAGETHVVLVGDEAYFSRVDFTQAGGREGDPARSGRPAPGAGPRAHGRRRRACGARAARLRRGTGAPTFPGMADEAVRPGLEGVLAAAQSLEAKGHAPVSEKGGRGLPPVHLWNPAHCGEIDIVIRKDGVWFHEGTPIGREALVRLFSTVLRKDPDGIHLVTPVEKMKITVEDAPFIATRVDRVGETLTFLTNVGDEVEAGPENYIRVEMGPDGEPRPYVHVRRGLEALIARPVFYELVEMAEERETPEGPTLGVASNGAWYPVGPAHAHQI